MLAFQQPLAMPDGTVMVVARGQEYSDLFHVDSNGHVIEQLTHNWKGDDPNTIRDNHWIFYPKATPNGQTLFYSTDSPKQVGSYEVDFNIWATPVNGTEIEHATYADAGYVRGTHWTSPDYYTGGDTDPQPLQSGGLLYVTYTVTGDGKTESSLVYAASTRTVTPVQLTDPAQNCNAAQLNPQQTEVVMVCTADHQNTSIEIAPFANGKLGTATTVQSGSLLASPQWSPDGKSLIYIAPDSTSHFQLWWIDSVLSAPAAPKQVTESLDLDATSAPSWFDPSVQATPAATPAPTPTPTRAR
jgi:Tol biopolymer transport system component